VRILSILLDGLQDIQLLNHRFQGSYPQAGQWWGLRAPARSQPQGLSLWLLYSLSLLLLLGHPKEALEAFLARPWDGQFLFLIPP